MSQKDTNSSSVSLFLVCAIEFLERFAFYCSFSLFVIYMTNSHEMTEGEAASLYGTFIGLSYFAQLPGGILLHRMLSKCTSIILGICLMTLGYGLLTTQSKHLFWGLGFLVLGSGPFKAGVISMVSSLYLEKEQNECAFQWFYIAVNCGAVLGPCIGSTVFSGYGWKAACWLSVFALSLGLILSTALQKALKRSVSPPAPDPLRQSSSTIAHHELGLFIGVCAACLLFWVGYHQAGTTFIYFARDQVDRTLGGRLHPGLAPSAFLSLPGVLFLVLSPLLLLIFRLLRRAVSTPGKLIAGLLLGTATMAILTLAAQLASADGHVGVAWIAGAYTLLTLAELCLEPIGLSLISRLVPARWFPLYVGAWYGVVALGGTLAGEIGRVWNRWPHSMFFALLAALSLMGAAILAALRRPLRKALDES